MTAAGKPLIHHRITPVADDAQALVPFVKEYPFTFADLNVGNAYSVPIEPGTVIEGAFLVIGTAFDAASVDVGDATDPNGFIAAGACTAGFVSSVGGAGAYAVLGGKMYSATSMLTVDFADACTAGAGTLYVKMLSLS